jgi:mannose-6-phosphate isomerase-like protein (cupin superfamily)
VPSFHHRKLPSSSALLSGRSPRDDLGFQSDQLQILYRNTGDPWSDSDVHTHRESDECFIVLQGELTVEVEGERVSIGPREICFFPQGVYHALVETHPPLEVLIIRAPSLDDKSYRALQASDWPDFLGETGEE